ncbi:dimethyl sulfoxide reductase anchor subunit [Rhodoferax sp. 4810]|uniref:Dimethyl sulfoxide reductase anchor subunit n=1 Tax=Thiospirillum jenense TaxID=1653858 RepID=A0A839H4F5_9GAMM|nr:sulfite dehydrogenase subunit SoeC [Thiospirillum jenense]MBB1073076.1 dimethyl sulfoxide reductase anchor subunit [Rhodoferax jenense]MBB1125023.1 dimethyl sulfoxide reductase anchor subunit [Thiospirillum jenense]
MHPAFSVILLTTLLGAGQGVFLALVTGQVYASIKLIEAQDASFYVGGSVITIILLISGLIASFFHLGRPERAWRAAAKWRTSWLSREVIILPALMILVAFYGLVHWLGWTNPLFIAGADALPIDASLVLGVIGAVLAFALFVSTAMIYANVEFIAEWHSPLTVANFTFLGLGSGFMLAAAYSAALGNHLVTFYGTWAVIFTVIGLVSRGASLLRNRHIKPKSNLQSAIGVRHRLITQRAQGFTGGSFNTREFFHHAPPAVLQRMRTSFLILVFPVPILLIAIAYVSQSATLPIIAFLLQYTGLIAERWLFFADAQHPQNLYYQSVA